MSMLLKQILLGAVKQYGIEIVLQCLREIVDELSKDTTKSNHLDKLSVNLDNTLKEYKEKHKS